MRNILCYICIVMDMLREKHISNWLNWANVFRFVTRFHMYLHLVIKPVTVRLFDVCTFEHNFPASLTLCIYLDADMVL